MKSNLLLTGRAKYRKKFSAVSMSTNVRKYRLSTDLNCDVMNAQLRVPGFSPHNSPTLAAYQDMLRGSPQVGLKIQDETAAKYSSSACTKKDQRTKSPKSHQMNVDAKRNEAQIDITF